MGLRALLSPELEPLDLWLSARHSGRRLLGPRATQELHFQTKATLNAN
jgi:hypothetical protein